MNRRVIALAVLAIWAVGIGWLYRRNTLRTPEQILAEAALRISPATWYYILEQNGNQVGAASSAIDTTTSMILSSDFLRGAVPVGPDTLRLEARSEASFTRGLRLRDFNVRATGDLAPLALRGVMQKGEDNTLLLTSKNEGDRAITQEMIVSRALFVPTMSPLPLLLRGTPRIGDTAQVAIFDPVSRRIRDVTMRIEADSLFLVSDSARFHSPTGRWVRARQASVRGWRITTPEAPITAWVDASGRLLAASEPGGISLVRTTFELSFENWRLANAGKGRGSSPFPARTPGR
ncbi:MAG: hypothetical protein WKF55_14770 [Gemmatimonadaceae bacterium]